MDMDALKDERSSRKRSITVLASRLKKAIQKGLSSSTITNLFSSLEQGYLDFLQTDDEYINRIEEDETLKDKYEMVNLLNLEDYTASVDAAYQEAKGVYQQHRRTKRANKVASDTDENSDGDFRVLSCPS